MAIKDTKYIYLDGNGKVVSRSTNPKEIIEPKLVSLGVTERKDNVNISNVVNVPFEYWKWENDQLVEMTQAEKDAITITHPDPVLDIKPKDGVYKYIVEDYKSSKLIKRMYYKDKDNSGFTSKVKEELYTYSGNSLISETVKEYNRDGSLYNTIKYNYYTENVTDPVEGKITRITKEFTY